MTLERWSLFREDRSMTRIPFSEILVPLGGRTSNLRALPVADDLARRLGAPIRIVSAVDPETDLRERRDLLTKQLDGLGINVLDIELRRAPSVADALNEVAAVGSLVVMTASAVSGAWDLILGTSTSDVLSYCTAPVLAVGPHCAAATDFSTFVVSVDGSPESTYAAEVAGGLAGALGADVTVIQVVDPDLKLPADLSEVSLVHQVALGMTTAGEKNWDVIHSTHRATAIVEVATHLPGSVICLGSRGMDRMHQLVFGSTTRKILASSPVPVMVAILHPELAHAAVVDMAKTYRAVPFRA
jgi:nucleotide-binding universal stress UspA family protein